jgi:tRNA 2-selenouridine synthase
LDAAQPVFVESESRKIGQLHVPELLIERMRREGRCVMVEMPDAARVALLLEEYAFFMQQPERFCQQLDALVALRGRERVAAWQALAREGHWADVFLRLMQEHYDPLYLKSMERNYVGAPTAQRLALASHDVTEFTRAAQELLESRPKG